MKKKVIGSIKITLALFLLFFLLQQSKGLPLDRVEPQSLIIATLSLIVVILIINVLASLQFYLAIMTGENLGFLKFTRIFFYAMSTSFFLPSLASEAVILPLLKNKNVRYAQSSAGFFRVKFINILVTVLLASLLAMPKFLIDAQFLLLALIIITVFIVVLLNRSQWVITFLNRIPIIHKIPFEQYLPQLKSGPVQVMQITVLSVVKLVLSSAAIYIALLTFKSQSDFYQAFQGTLLGTVLGFASVTPKNLGTFEYGLSVMCPLDNTKVIIAGSMFKRCAGYLQLFIAYISFQFIEKEGRK